MFLRVFGHDPVPSCFGLLESRPLQENNSTKIVQIHQTAFNNKLHYDCELAATSLVHAKYGFSSDSQASKSTTKQSAANLSAIFVLIKC